MQKKIITDKTKNGDINNDKESNLNDNVDKKDRKTTKENNNKNISTGGIYILGGHPAQVTPQSCTYVQVTKVTSVSALSDVKVYVERLVKWMQVNILFCVLFFIFHFIFVFVFVFVFVFILIFYLYSICCGFHPVPISVTVILFSLSRRQH